MVDLRVHDDTLEVEIRGLHKVWALKSRLRVPLAAIAGVRRAPPDATSGWWKGWRVPGTHLPGVIVAGTYYKDGEKHFWDVRNPERAVEIDLVGSEWDRLYLEVDDPDGALRLLQGSQIG